MKKYFVLALALMAFAVAPVMADVAISGAYDYSAAWNTGDSEFADAVDDLSLDFKTALDDYNSFVLKTDGADDEKLELLDYMVTTDWGKYFGFAESGFGLTTKVGHWDPETSDLVCFTAYEIESQNPDIADRASWQINMDIMGMVKPYAAMNFRSYPDGSEAGSDFLIGTDVEFAPVAAEVYYKGAGAEDAVGSVFGLGAMYSAEVADGVVANAGATFGMSKADKDNWAKKYSVAAGVEAYGAVANVALNGYFLPDDLNPQDLSLALSNLTFDASYDILEWLGVNGGLMMAMGDYAENVTNDETFIGAEFGISVSPGAVKYSLGYIVTSEDAVYPADIDMLGVEKGAVYDSYTAYDAPANGGIYFAVDLEY